MRMVRVLLEISVKTIQKILDWQMQVFTINRIPSNVRKLAMK